MDALSRRPDFERLAAFERERVRRTPPDFQRSLRIVEALYWEAVALGAWGDVTLEGVEHHSRMAQAFRV